MTFLRLNPEYEYILMDDHDVKELICRFAPSYALKVAFEVLKYGACRSDIWRMVVLERYGGVYIDTDMYAKKRFHDFIPNDAEFILGK